jgi:hypothetical protein
MTFQTDRCRAASDQKKGGVGPKGRTNLSNKQQPNNDMTSDKRNREPPTSRSAAARRSSAASSSSFCRLAA